MNPVAGLGIAAVRFYQWTLRPLIGANCRFHPSCSEYAVEALRTQGAGRGTALALWRVLRCNPWTAGGYDPVPPAKPKRAKPNSRPDNGAPHARAEI